MFIPRPAGFRFNIMFKTIPTFLYRTDLCDYLHKRVGSRKKLSERGDSIPWWVAIEFNPKQTELKGGAILRL